jgi:hypothetical protein
VESGLRLYVVVQKSTFIFKLRPMEEKTLPSRIEAIRYVSASNNVREIFHSPPFLVLDLSFNVVDSVRRLDLECEWFLRRGSIHEDLHRAGYAEDS